MILNGLRVSRTRLDAVGTATAERRTRTTSGATGSVSRVVSAAVLAETAASDCKCEDPRHMARLGLQPLREGMLVDQLVKLGSGCTKGRWVCSRLDNLRRRYGK